MKRFKKSKFDPYINEIYEYIAAGMSVRSIADELDQYFDDVVSESAIYVFIKSRGLKTKYSGGLNRYYEPPRCDKCEDCHEVLNVGGKTTRMCHYSRLINKNVTTSPPWCPKRKRQVV